MTSNLMPWRRLFDDSLFSQDAMGLSAPLDIVEAEDHYLVTVDLPGVNADQVDIEFKEGRLWISGQRTAVKREEGKKYHLLERRTGKFQRVIGLPDDVAADGIEATFRDGVLYVEAAKAETAKPKKIEVKSG